MKIEVRAAARGPGVVDDDDMLRWVEGGGGEGER